MSLPNRLRVGAWTLGSIVSLAAIIRWSDVRLTGGEVSPYDLFPLLGLLAFSLMWTHYVTDAVRRFLELDDDLLSSYFSVTAWIVFVLILLHPGLLYVALWRDGFGLPPFSPLELYGSGAGRIALLAGLASFVVFLAFELHRRYKNASWWRYVDYANLAAMAAIFYHALVLGGEVGGWYQIVWIGHGVTLAAAASYTYRHKHTREGAL